MMGCAVCGATNERVRGCCDHPDAQPLCDPCYLNNRGRHNSTHTAQIPPPPTWHWTEEVPR